MSEVPRLDDDWSVTETVASACMWGDGWQDVMLDSGHTVNVPPGMEGRSTPLLKRGDRLQVYYLADQWTEAGFRDKGLAGGRIVGYRINGSSKEIRMPTTAQHEYTQQLLVAFRIAKASDPSVRFFAFCRSYELEHPEPPEPKDSGLGSGRVLH